MATRKENSTYTRNEQCIINCDLTYAVHKIGGRWKLPILTKLEKGKSRFTDLKKEFFLYHGTNANLAIASTGKGWPGQ